MDWVPEVVHNMSLVSRMTALRLKLVLQKVPSELHPKVRNHGEGPY